MYIFNSSNGFNNKRYLLTRCYDALYYFVTVCFLQIRESDFVYTTFCSW